MIKERSCAMCGAKFYIYDRKQMKQKYCSESCRRAMQQKQAKEHKIAENAKKRAKGNKNIVNINEEARKLGLTYGQYQAMKYMEARNG